MTHDMSETFAQRLPVEQAEQLIARRLADGWVLLGLEGLWSKAGTVQPDLDYVFDGSPDGLDDPEDAASLLST